MNVHTAASHHLEESGDNGRCLALELVAESIPHIVFMTAPDIRLSS